MSYESGSKIKPFVVKPTSPENRGETPEENEKRIERDEKSTKPVLKDALARIKAQMAHLPKPKME